LSEAQNCAHKAQEAQQGVAHAALRPCSSDQTTTIAQWLGCKHAAAALLAVDPIPVLQSKEQSLG
jgi:hypothetical protein